MLYTLRRCQGRGAAHHAVLRDVRQPRHLPRRLGRGDAPFDSLADGARLRRSRTTSGSSTTSPRTSARPTISPRRIRQSSRSCRTFHEGGRAQSRAARSTTAAPSASTPRSPAGPISWAAARRSPSTRDDRHHGKRLHQHQGPFITRSRPRSRCADAKTNGVIIAQAGCFGGWALYMKDGRVAPRLQLLRRSAHTRSRRRALAAGQAHDRLRVHSRRGEARHRRQVDLSVDGKVAAEGHIAKTQPFVFSADEGVDVGVDNETMVSDDYKRECERFKGEIVKVTVAQL